MIRSMTGFGRGEASVGEHRFVAEIKSVNHRFLTTKVRLPREFARYERHLVAECAKVCERGHVTLTVEVESVSQEDGAFPRVNRQVVERIVAIARDLGAEDGISGEVSVAELLALPGALDWSGDEAVLDEEVFGAGADESAARALEALVASRSTEGEALDRDLRQRLQAIEKWRQVLGNEAPGREAAERDRLRAKVAELAPDGADIEGRVAQEIVILADRLDISEELTRLRVHCEQFLSELDTASGPIGRKLTFLLQEMNREANTVASKANNAAMQQAAIEIKSELEKMREQVENVE